HAVQGAARVGGAGYREWSGARAGPCLNGVERGRAQRRLRPEQRLGRVAPLSGLVRLARDRRLHVQAIDVGRRLLRNGPVGIDQNYRVWANSLADRLQQLQPIGVLALGAPPIQQDSVHYAAAHERLRLTSDLCTKGIVMPIEQIVTALRPTQDALTAGVPLPPGTGVRKITGRTVSVAELGQ